MAWADALAAGTLVNLAGARAALPAGTPALEIERMWRAAACVKLAPGTYAAELVDAPCARRLIVVNGFYGAMRDKFTSTALAPNGVRWMRVAWDARKLTWAAFRGDVVGATNPAKAAPGSLRGKLHAGWRALGLPAAPFGADNGIHASASPIEALNERLIWLGGELARDELVAQAVRFGTDRAEACYVLGHWRGNPVVPPLRRAPAGGSDGGGSSGGGGGSGGAAAAAAAAAAGPPASVFDQMELADTGEVVRLVAAAAEARVEARRISALSTITHAVICFFFSFSRGACAVFAGGTGTERRAGGRQPAAVRGVPRGAPGGV